MNPIIQKLFQLTQSTRNGHKTPHKPALIIWYLHQYQRGQPRLIGFSSVSENFGNCLAALGHDRSGAAEPYWRLLRDGIWELNGLELSSKKPSNKALQRTAAGLTDDVFSAINSGEIPKLIADLSDRYLTAEQRQQLMACLRDN